MDTELRLEFLLRYGYLPNGELYHLLRTDSEFRNKYWKIDERLTRWYEREIMEKYGFQPLK